ncbi:MAG: hypothetical protein JNK49_02080 [Planctomycetes bacterium]|nr:hypothetical protein [Planctomycetota bacterium]
MNPTLRWTLFASSSLLAGCATGLPDATRTLALPLPSTGAVPAASAGAGAPAAAPAADDAIPNGLVAARLAVGRTRVAAEDGTRGNANASMLGLDFEATGRTFGGGVSFEVLASDDDLYEQGSAVDSSTAGIDLFPHFTIRPNGKRFRLPIRLGPVVQWSAVNVDDGTDDDTVHWYGAGARVELEPEFDLIPRGGGQSLSIYGRGRLGGAFGQVSADTATDDRDYDTTSSHWGVEGGLRWEIGKLMVAGGYQYTHTTYGETDATDGFVFPETRFRFSGVFLSVGFRW